MRMKYWSGNAPGSMGWTTWACGCATDRYARPVGSACMLGTCAAHGSPGQVAAGTGAKCVSGSEYSTAGESERVARKGERLPRMHERVCLGPADVWRHARARTHTHTHTHTHMYENIYISYVRRAPGRTDVACQNGIVGKVTRWLPGGPASRQANPFDEIFPLVR